MQPLSQNRDSQGGGDCAAILACSIRRNGNRHYALNPTPLRRRPHWPTTQVQTTFISPGATSCAEAGRSQMFRKGVLLPLLLVLAGMLAAAQ